MHPFEAYLKECNIDPLDLSLEAQVRYFTVWNAIKGNPISSEHARKIQLAVLSLTGSPYTGSLAVLEAEPIENRQTVPMKRIHNPARK
jgi:predicted transcriptional regulator